MIIPYPDGLAWDRWAATIVGFNPEVSAQLHPNMGWQLFLGPSFEARSPVMIK